MLNRRHLMKAAAASVAAGAVPASSTADAPPGPFDGPTARFDKARADEPPAFAFREPLVIPPTPRPTAVAERKDLDGPTPRVSAFGPTDTMPIGDCFHGVAREWAEMPAHWADYSGKLTVTDPPKVWEEYQRIFGRVPTKRKDGATGDGTIRNWGEFPVRCYKIPIEEARIKFGFLPLPTLCYAFAGMVPGPTLRMRLGQPSVVRFHNHLETEVSVHFHGGHNPSHSDGFPSFYVLQGKSRDYFYPNMLPLIPKRDDDTRPATEAGYVVDVGESQSTCWYHDHGMDCTGYNVSKGIAGLALVFGENELDLIARNVLPGEGEKSCIDPDLHKLSDDPTLEDPKNPGFYCQGKEPYYNPFDLPIVIQDKVFDRRTGQISFDTNGHNGYLGDTFLLNGVPWPVTKVKNRKIRFRFLNGSNARIYRLRFLSEADYLARRAGGAVEADAAAADAEACGPAAADAGPGGHGDYDDTAATFLRIGKDSWLWPQARNSKSVLLAMANRADVVVDFKRLAKDLKEGEQAVFYLVNTMGQTDGRGPKVKLDDPGDPRVLPLPFDTVATADGVRATRVAEMNRPVALMKIIVEGPPVSDDATVEHGTCLNPHDPIEDHEVQAVREFVFERGKGAWQINGRFYDPTLANAAPTHDTAEEWVLRNGGGGWWHPIHIHLESHQIVSYQKDFDADAIIDTQDPPAIPRLTRPVEVVGQMDTGDQVGLHDTQVLGPNTVVRIRMRFRTWNGPFVFHCHNLEHEDMRMMFNFEPVPRPRIDQESDDTLTNRRRRLANTAPDARTHGNDLTHQPDPDRKRFGELPWEIAPVPATPVADAADDVIAPRGHKTSREDR